MNQTLKALIIGAACAALSIAARADTATVDVKQTAETRGLGDMTLAAGKLVFAFIQTNGVQSITTGFGNIGGKGGVTVAPVLGHDIELCGVGKIGVDRLMLAAGVDTYFAPKCNKEQWQVALNWHLFKVSKVGKLLAFDFNDISLTAGAGVPCEWITGKKIRGIDVVPQLGLNIHF